MKKTAVWILVCICLLGLAGCGIESKENGKPEQENAVVSVFYIANGKEIPLQISPAGAAEIEKQVNNEVIK